MRGIASLWGIKITMAAKTKMPEHHPIASYISGNVRYENFHILNVYVGMFLVFFFNSRRVPITSRNTQAIDWYVISERESNFIIIIKLVCAWLQV